MKTLFSYYSNYFNIFQERKARQKFSSDSVDKNQ
jgi:hypothetical protein